MSAKDRAQALLQPPDYALGLEVEIHGLKERLNGVYRERNLLVAALGHLIYAEGQGTVWVAKHVPDDPDEAWDETWQTVLFIEADSGDAVFQFSWHFHIDEVSLLQGLPTGPNKWDGHTTEEKYENLVTWWSQL